MAQLKNMTAGGVLPVASPPATVRSYDILTYSKGKVAPAVFLRLSGGPTWIRTRDHPVMSRGLCQLSYRPKLQAIWQGF